MTNPKVIFDHGPLPDGSVFDAPSDIIRADTLDQVVGAFEAMEKARQSGKWLAGCLSYEFGYLNSAKLTALMPPYRDLPLINFGVFDGPTVASPVPVQRATLTPPRPCWTQDRYRQAFDILHDYISAGDIYQANLTLPMDATYSGTPEALYAKLRDRQPVPHGAYVDLGGPILLSRSPELFFEVSVDRTLITRPMKGTAPRGTTQAEDDALREALQKSVKNRAENLMIVDLLRNDMSRVSEIGSVQVPRLFDVERFATLHQMTSEITSRLKTDTSLYDLFMALFPCGSITGAPKVRAMQFIHELEDTPREAYCGAIGWLAPDGAMSFNVAIRTLICRPDGTVRMNVGGGIVYDSTAEDEYAEALLKSQFAILPD